MKNWLPSLRLHRTAIVFSLVLFAVIVAAFGQYTQAADKVAKLDAEVKRYQTSPAVDQIALMSYLKDIPIPLAGLAKDMTIIRNRTFDGCDIHGPAVVLLNYGTNQVFSCTVDAPFDAAFIVTTNTAATGIVAFDNCTFKNCKFRNVSFLGDSDAIAKVRSEFVFDSTK